MTRDEPETGVAVDRCASAIPPMAAGLHLRLMTSTMVLVGSIAPGHHRLLGDTRHPGDYLPGRRLLAADRREVPGEVEKVEHTDTEVLGQRIYRYRYSFTPRRHAPPRRQLRGESDTRSWSQAVPQSGWKATHHGRVSSPQPRINRLQGTHTGFMPAIFLPWG